MEKEKLSAQEINKRGENVIKKYGLKNIRSYQPENELSKYENISYQRHL